MTTGVQHELSGPLIIRIIVQLRISFFFFFLRFTYLFLAMLGLCCCMQASSSCHECRLLFVVVHRLLIAVAFLAAEHEK